MKPSELFEGENSSLKMTFNNAVRDSRCNQCKLENNRGVCDRNDCSNKSINTMRERFDTIFSPAFKAIAIRLNDPDNVAKLVENLKLSIEQELKKEREEIQECVMTILDVATPFESPRDTIDCIKVDMNNYFDKLSTPLKTNMTNNNEEHSLLNGSGTDISKHFTNNNWEEKLTEIVFRNWKNDDEVGLFVEVKDLLTKKDQEHKAELEMIRKRIMKISWKVASSQKREYNLHRKPFLEILDSHINKLSKE